MSLFTVSPDAPGHASVVVDLAESDSVADEPQVVLLDPYAVAVRVVTILVGSHEAARELARSALLSSIDRHSSAAFDLVVPCAVDLVLRRAARIVAEGNGPHLVEDFAERLVLWRRLSRREGIEQAAVLLSLAPFPTETIAAMLRLPVGVVHDIVDGWFAPEGDAETVRGHIPEGTNA
ncbi:MAG: hypothetical protein R2698_11305 [Microthrixaceae bacterium]